jgi:hypothetical protein
VIRKPPTSLVVALAGGALVAGCGGNATSSTITITPGHTTGATPSSTTTTKTSRTSTSPRVKPPDIAKIEKLARESIAKHRRLIEEGK